MSQQNASQNATSGKLVVIVFGIMCALFISALIVGYFIRIEPEKEKQIVKELIDQQYLKAKKEADIFSEKKEYVKAISILQKFLKKFSHRNHYKDVVEKQIEELKKQVKQNM